MLLSSDVQASVKQVLDTLSDPVTVKLYLKADEPSSTTMKDLWEELQTLSPKLMVETASGRPPGMASEEMEGVVSEVWYGGRFTGIRYLGIPSGYEFGPLIETLAEVSRNEAPSVSPDLAAWLKGLQKPLHFQVFVTPT